MVINHHRHRVGKTNEQLEHVLDDVVLLLPLLQYQHQQFRWSQDLKEVTRKNQEEQGNDGDMDFDNYRFRDPAAEESEFSSGHGVRHRQYHLGDLQEEEGRCSLENKGLVGGWGFRRTTSTSVSTDMKENRHSTCHISKLELALFLNLEA